MLDIPEWLRIDMENLKQADQRHELRLGEQDRRIEGHQHRITQLERDMGDIRTMLAKTATKDDINLILRDALNSVPGRQTMLWSAALVMITALALFIHK
jgi:hypothetical protein